MNMLEKQIGRTATKRAREGKQHQEKGPAFAFHVVERNHGGVRGGQVLDSRATRKKNKNTQRREGEHGAKSK